MADKVLDKLATMGGWRLFLFCVVLSELLAMIAISICSFTLEGYLDSSHMAVGFVATFFASSLVAYFIIGLTHRISNSREKFAGASHELSFMLDKTSETFCRTNNDGTIVWVSDSVTAMYGYEPDDVIGKSITEFYIDKGDRQRMLGELENGGGRVRGFETDMIMKNGKTISLSVNAGYYLDDSGKVAGVYSATRDIRVRKEAEVALQESEEKLRVIMGSLQEGVFLIQEEKLIYVNERLLDMVGRSYDEMIGCPFIEIIAKEERQRVEHIHNMRMRGDNVPRQYETILSHGDSTTKVYVHMVVSVIQYGGKPAAAGTVTDITHKRKLGRELLKAQKLESVGVLAGGIAHDFNNLLTSIMGSLSILKLGDVKQDEGKQIMEEALVATRRAKDLTTQLLTFSSGGKPKKDVINFKDFLEETVSFSLRGSSTAYKVEMQENLWNIDADLGQISQVINNLVINSDQAMPNGGTTAIRVENVEMEHGNMMPLVLGRYLHITVKDEGVGIPRNNIQKVFDPYFTSKKKGSGLGLATSYSVVKNHDGYIYVNSIPDKGTTFHMYLPATDKPMDEKSKEKQKLKVGKGLVMVMDDEDVVRDVLCRMLRRLGYDVEEAEDGQAAIDKYRKRMDEGKPFNLVIADLTIPGGMGGQEMVKTLAEIDSGVTVIASSGYSGDMVMINPQEYGFKATLKKPFDMEMLSEAVQLAIADDDK